MTKRPLTINALITRTNQQLKQRLPKENPSYPTLAQAMRYATLNNGKRIRPTLVYLAGTMLGATLEQLDAPACAIEFIHCFSLVHDDLPAMDNSDLRRGQASCHKAFSEDLAILAGDALVTQAFETIITSNSPLNDKQRINMLQCLCNATGAYGMVAGQVMDINNENNTKMSLAKLKTLHTLKTGELIKASVLLGGHAAPNATQNDLDQLEIFGETLGLLYQVCDDILDVTADENILGKQSGTDEVLGKFTYINALGLDGSKNYARELQQDCLKALKNLKSNSEHLATIANNIFQRV